MEIQKDDLTRGLSVGEEVNLVNTICKKFDDFVANSRMLLVQHVFSKFFS